MRFALASQGTRAEKPLTFPVACADGTTTELACVARPLSAMEEADALEYATQFAKSRWDASSQALDPLFELGHMIKVVAIAIRDPDSGAPGSYKRFATAKRSLRSFRSPPNPNRTRPARASTPTSP